jgi:hypothetical protein
MNTTNSTFEDFLNSSSGTSVSWQTYVIMAIGSLNIIVSITKQFLNNKKHMTSTDILNKVQSVTDEALKLLKGKNIEEVKLDIPINLKGSEIEVVNT